MEIENLEYNLSSINVHHEPHFPLDLNYPLASSSGAGESIMLFDLNQIPPE